MQTPLALVLLAALVLAVIVTIVAARLKARGLQLDKRAKFIQAYRFPDALRRQLQDRDGLSLAKSGLVLEGLRQYFLACLSAQRRSIANQVGMPSKVVDDTWHDFILMTREYEAFCHAAFGKYLHHTPAEQMQGPSKDALANTLHQFKQPPLTPAGWAMLGAVPLLFAIDREVGLTSGQDLEASTMAELEARRLVLVASHGDSSAPCGDSGPACNSGSESGGGSCGGGGGDGGA